MSGWVKLPRSTEGHPALQSATRRGLFDRLYLMAARQPTRKDWRGTTVGLDVGQAVISVRDFAEDNDVGYKEARLHLARLEREGLISLETIRGANPGARKGAIGTLVTVHFKRLLGENEEDRGATLGAVNGAAKGAMGAQEGRNGGAPVEETLETLETANHVEPESLTAPSGPAPEARDESVRRDAQVPPDPDSATCAYLRWVLRAHCADPGRVIGRWRRDYGKAAVFEAADWYRKTSQGEHVEHPISSIGGELSRLAGKRKRPATEVSDDELRAQLNAIEEAARATLN